MALNRSIIQKEQSFWKQHKIKFASTFIAMFIWFLVVTRDPYEYKVSVPIHINQENHSDLVITSPIPEKAYILVQGPGRYLLSYMLFQEASLRLDVPWTLGRHIILPTEKDVMTTGNAGNLEVTKYIGPDSIVVEIERLVVKEIPVQNNISIQPMASYTIVGDVTMEPDVVRVQGPERALKELKWIATPTKSFKDLKYPFHEKFSLIPPDNKYITLLDTEIEIAAEIQLLLEKKLEKIPVTVRYLPHGVNANVQPKFISLKIQGGYEIVSNITDKNIDAYVEYHSVIDSVLNNEPIKIEPIKEVTFRDLSTERVKVSLIKEDPDQ